MARGRSRPTICLCMIARDEAHIVRETIASVAPYVDTWVVVDTGSTDGTLEVVRSAFAALGVSGETYERPWKDFGFNRTESLRLCGTRADYIWVIDADDLVVGSLDLSKLTLDSYLLRFGSNFRFWRRQVFRSALHWEYRGVVHEHPVCLEADTTEGRLEGAYHIESRHLGSRNLKADKFERDIRLLRDALESDPADARSVFYLAQSEFDSGDWKAALATYARRASMGGFEEEVFYSLLRCGECHELLSAPWEKALDAYLRAWQSRPRRAEPLHQITRYYRAEGSYELAEFFARRAKAIPFPQGDLLFVSADVYDWRIDDELSICAFWLGRHRESFDLCTRLLEVPGVPEEDRERILANRDFPGAHLVDDPLAYPEAAIRRLTERVRKVGGDHPLLTLPITSRRRPLLRRAGSRTRGGRTSPSDRPSSG
jgi:tetratricopeptide (TPR) repeat protein